MSESMRGGSCEGELVSDDYVIVMERKAGRLRPVLVELCVMVEDCGALLRTWREGDMLVMQHGPNPEHVALCDLKRNPLGEATRAFEAAWLARVHAPEVPDVGA